jgi:hypothetical protein
MLRRNSGRQAEQVRGDEHPAQDLTDHGAQRERHRVRPDGARAGVPGQGALNAADHLGHEQRRAEALDDAREDQGQHVRRDPACERSQRERREPDEKNSPVAVERAQARRRDQEHRGREHVHRNGKLQFGAGSVQRRADRRCRDVDDRGVDVRHELTRQDHADEKPGSGDLHKRIVP